ncbi:MAG: hypothetical protein HOV83_07215 [Catenulispora sp.]|nr:hypothetical protein [Catenulispora sp.]
MLKFDNPTAMQRLMLRMERLSYARTITYILGWLALWGSIAYTVWTTRAWEHVPMWVTVTAGAGVLLTLASGVLWVLDADDSRLLRAMADEKDPATAGPASAGYGG